MSFFNVCVFAAIFLSYLSPEECGLSCTKPSRYKMADGKNWSPDPWPSALYSYPCLRNFCLREVTRKVTNKHKCICWDSTIYYTIFNKAQQKAKKKDILRMQWAVVPHKFLSFFIRFLQIVSIKILVQFGCVITRKMSCSSRLFHLLCRGFFSLRISSSLSSLNLLKAWLLIQ